jgi:hypothetical protein
MLFGKTPWNDGNFCFVISRTGLSRPDDSDGHDDDDKDNEVLWLCVVW